MPGFLEKPLREITSDDVQRICDEKMPEAADLEFKSQLPLKKGGRLLTEDAASFTDYTIIKLLTEIVAFANSHGGLLIIGIDETSDKPARAEKVLPLPACAAVAEKLRLICRDCIEPKLPTIEIEGVVTADDGAGVILCRVSASRLAPHRLIKTLQCYIRRNDRSEAMSMREIQDLTLFKERGTKGIEDLFEIRAKRFASRTGSPPDMIFLRATAVPLTPVFVKRVHARGDLRPSLLRYVTLKDAETAVLQEVDPYSLAWCPVIGGTRARFEKSRRYVDIELSDTGLLEYMASVECQPEERGWFSLIPMIEMICSAIISVDRFRTGAGAPNAETGLEVAIIVNQNFARVVPAGHGADDAFGNLGRGLHSFPRYSFAEIGEMPLVLNELIRDIANAAGVDFPSSLAIEMVTRI